VLVAAFSQPLLLPITPFAITAGFLFGFWKALWVMLAAKMLAASINFGLTRSFAKTPALWLTRRFPLFYHLNASLEKEGLRFAILLRLCPFPFAVASYGYGLTRLRFPHYLIATFVGILAPTLIFTAVGASARSGLRVVELQRFPQKQLGNVAFSSGIGGSFFVTRRIARIARHWPK